jgi:hypothetical protein
MRVKLRTNSALLKEANRVAAIISELDLFQVAMACYECKLVDGDIRASLPGHMSIILPLLKEYVEDVRILSVDVKSPIPPSMSGTNQLAFAEIKVFAFDCPLLCVNIPHLEYLRTVPGALFIGDTEDSKKEHAEFIRLWKKHDEIVYHLVDWNGEISIMFDNIMDDDRSTDDRFIYRFIDKAAVKEYLYSQIRKNEI